MLSFFTSAGPVSYTHLSLNYIKQLPLDIIKVDKTFIDDIVEDDYAQAFVKLIVDLSNYRDRNGYTCRFESNPVYFFPLDGTCAVSYTHLDVYKRQLNTPSITISFTLSGSHFWSCFSKDSISLCLYFSLVEKERRCPSMMDA